MAIFEFVVEDVALVRAKSKLFLWRTKGRR